MAKSIEKVAIIQPMEGKLKYGYFNSNTNSFGWQNIDLEEKRIDELISNKLQNYKNIIVLPDIKLLESCLSERTVLLITRGSKNLIKYLYPELHNSIWEVNEVINTKGDIELKLTEPEINNALRFVFTSKPKKLIISLNNSIFNSLHERTLYNVLNAAGYKSLVSMPNI